MLFLQMRELSCERSQERFFVCMNAAEQEHESLEKVFHASFGVVFGSVP